MVEPAPRQPGGLLVAFVAVAIGVSSGLASEVLGCRATFVVMFLAAVVAWVVGIRFVLDFYRYTTRMGRPPGERDI